MERENISGSMEGRGSISEPQPGSTGGGKGKMVAVGIWVFSFHPSTVRIAPGTMVAWVNHDSTEHTVTANDGAAFDTGAIPVGQAKTLTFTTAGTYGYHCSLHPFMTGAVVVR